MTAPLQPFRVGRAGAFTAPSRRDFLKWAATLAGGVAFTGFERTGLAADFSPPARSIAELPQGVAPPPVPLPHFPSRLHAFVWRNWSLAPVATLARVVGARTADLVRMGRAMGLGDPPRITADQRRRSYITVIKRNWHLLPYDQLLALLGWSAEELAYTLREDDFLYIKLGSLKPDCARLRYEAPDEIALAGERRVARVMGEEFASGEPADREPLFAFVADLSSRSGKGERPASAGRLKFCYSYFALYGDPLLETGSDPYPDGLLERLARAGVTGVWLPAVLCKLAPFPWEPERSARYETRLKNLRKLVARAADHGMRVFLYLNEPRALPLSFYQARPELRGAVEGDHASLCTSAPEVKRYLAEAVAAVCRAAPELGGFFTITASENQTNCWSHGRGASCPRCAKRSPAEVIAEVNTLFHEGMERSGSGARLIAWDWGWNDAWAGEVIEQLPKPVALMSVSEWRLPLHRGGVKAEVGEYSISAVGPGPRARRHWQLARERGLETLAKIQAGNTWELAAVPYIPAVASVAQHAENLRGMEVGGLMLGWTLGGYPSPNVEVVSEVLAGGSAEEALRRVAARRFGAGLAPLVVTAWREFSAAFAEYPYHIGVMYSAPQQLGPANLLWPEPTGCQATMVGFPYDDLDRWRAVYPPEIFARQFEKMAEGFQAALDRLQHTARDRAAAGSAGQRRAFAAECRVAEAAMLHFRSVANQTRFVMARRALAEAKTASGTAPILAALERILREEIRWARRLYDLQCRDSRLGFEASNHYFYVPADLMEKVLNCRYLLEEWLPRFRG